MDKNLIIGEIVLTMDARGDVWPALITRVHNDTMVNLRVLRDDGDYTVRSAVFAATLRLANQWTWKPGREPKP